MRNAPAPLIAFFNSRPPEIWKADLITIALTNGTVLRYTNWEVPITIGGNTFLSGPPNFEHSKITTSVGTEVGTCQFNLLANPTDTIGGVPILKMIAQGQFDWATYLLQRVFTGPPFPSTPAGATWLGPVNWFQGRLNVQKVGQTMAEFEARNWNDLLAIQVPINIMNPGCLHTLYDAGCTLNPASFTKSGTIQVGSTVNTLKTNLADPDHYYEPAGRIVFTSGPNNGLVWTVKTYLNSGGTLTFNRPLPNAPSTGDTFSIRAACDKQQGTCNAKFNNIVNFGGFPFVPAPETAI